jgi:hypothetical protein
MGHAAAGSYLCFGHPDIVEQLGPLKQRLVFCRVDEHRCAPAMLREDDGTLGPLDVADYRCQVRAEIGERADVLGWSQTGHIDSSEVVQKNVQSGGGKCQPFIWVALLWITGSF